MNSTVRAYLTEHLLQHHTGRLQRLRDLGAPEIVVGQEERLLAAAQAGQLGVHAGKGEDAEALLDTAFVAVEWRKGAGGKPYALFTGGAQVVRYFPQARFGRFITAVAA